MSVDLEERLARIYSAFGAIAKSDLSAYPMVAKVKQGVHGIGVDFRQGMSKEQLANAAHLVIHNVANLKDHFKKHLRAKGRDPKEADGIVASSRDLCLLSDLSNNDKHGYPPRDGGATGCSPKLGELRSTLRMSAGSKIEISPTTGALNTIAGKARVIVTGDIVDKDGARVGELYPTIEKAIEAWEKVLRKEGIVE